MMKKNWLDCTALTLVIVGGLNWGLVALNWNLVEKLFGSFSMYVYALVGLSALYMVFTWKKYRGTPAM